VTAREVDPRDVAKIKAERDALRSRLEVAERLAEALKVYARRYESEGGTCWNWTERVCDSYSGQVDHFDYIGSEQDAPWEIAERALAAWEDATAKPAPCGHTREQHLRMMTGDMAGACNWYQGKPEDATESKPTGLGAVVALSGVATESKPDEPRRCNKCGVMFIYRCECAPSAPPSSKPVDWPAEHPFVPMTVTIFDPPRCKTCGFSEKVGSHRPADAGSDSGEPIS
jgi:hypothetical protein